MAKDDDWVAVLLLGFIGLAILSSMSKPKCPTCKGTIEKGTPVCPHCATYLSWGQS